MLRRVLPAVLVLGAASLAAHALSLELFTESEIIALSERIVVGTVESTETRYADPDGDGKDQIVTFARFRVEQSFKGNDLPGDLLLLPMTGGTVGTETLTVSGLPMWTRGEHLVLCLDPNAESRSVSPIVGAIQGRWEIVDGGSAGLFAVHSRADAAYFKKDANGDLVPALPPPATREPLADLLSRIQTEVNK